MIKKLPTRPNKFDINSVREFYKTLNLKENPVHFTKVSEKTMSVFLKELKINKATGIDNLSVRLIKGGSKVPDECKTVKLKQLYKKYKKTDPRNPLFPVISIILEKVIHYQTMHFVTKNYI